METSDRTKTLYGVGYAMTPEINDSLGDPPVPLGEKLIQSLVGTWGPCKGEGHRLQNPCQINIRPLFVNALQSTRFSHVI